MLHLTPGFFSRLPASKGLSILCLNSPKSYRITVRFLRTRGLRTNPLSPAGVMPYGRQLVTNEARWAVGCAIALASVVIACALVLFYFRTSSGRILQRLPSPDNSVIAEVDKDGSDAAATDTFYTGVALRTRRNPIRYYVFGGLDYGANITVSWLDSNNLLIKCEQCSKLNGGNMKKYTWRKIVIHYDISN